MKKFDEYLGAIDIPQVIQGRVYEILDIVKNFLDIDEINDIYISEYVGQSSREFESLWIFTDKFISEAKNFRNEYNIDRIRVDCKFTYINIMYDKYDFVKRKATVNSRMILNVHSNSEGITCALKGSGLNCEYLHDIFNKYYQHI